jgi:hypothetical protein
VIVCSAAVWWRTSTFSVVRRWRLPMMRAGRPGTSTRCSNAPRIFDHPGLRVSAASPEHLLAMKVLAARRRDAEDIRFLVKHLQLGSAENVLALCTEIFPDEPVPDRVRLILDDIFDDV